MKKLTVNEKAAYSLAAAMTALFLCTALLSFSLMGMLSRTENKFSRYRTDAEIELSDLEKKKNEISARITELNNSLELAEKSKSELEIKIGQTENELNELKSSIGNTDELYKKLNSQLKELNNELDVKKSEIASLSAEITELKKTYGADINKQYEILTEIAKLLNAPPKVLVTPASYDSNGNEISAAVYRDAKVSLYYEDLIRGQSFKHNVTEKFPSSGCLRTPFALSVLIAASDEMAEYDRKLAEYEALHGPTEELPDFVFKYDMSKIFTYTAEKEVSGAGIIKDSEHGTEYTHYELFEAYLKYGDAVAEKELTTVYGTSLRKNLLSNLGTSVMKSDPSKATASDLSLVMKKVYSFIGDEGAYSDLLRDGMKSGVHNVMITPGIVGKDVIHSSGWDKGAYHDMALVYDDNPYVLIFMSDLDGGEEANKYINKLASLVDSLHKTFYE